MEGSGDVCFKPIPLDSLPRDLLVTCLVSLTPIPPVQCLTGSNGIVAICPASPARAASVTYIVEGHLLMHFTYNIRLNTWMVHLDNLPVTQPVSLAERMVLNFAVLMRGGVSIMPRS